MICPAARNAASDHQSRPAVNHNRSCHTLPLPRVGFDRLDFTATSNRSLPTLPTRILDYKRQRDCRIRHQRDSRIRRTASGFRRCAQYRHVTDENAPAFDILYDPSERFCPKFRVSCRAPANLSRLLDLGAVAEVLDFLSHHAHSSLQLSEIELTLDLSQEWLSELRRAYLLRARTRHKQGTWCVVGSRRSAFSVRSYQKDAPGISLARIEIIVRRDGLRKLAVNDLAGLKSCNVAEVVTKRLRFVGLDPAARCDAGERMELQRSLATVGVNKTLQRLPKAKREWLRRHLVPSPIEYEFLTLVRSLRVEYPPERRDAHNTVGMPPKRPTCIRRVSLPRGSLSQVLTQAALGSTLHQPTRRQRVWCSQTPHAAPVRRVRTSILGLTAHAPAAGLLRSSANAFPKRHWHRGVTAAREDPPRSRGSPVGHPGRREPAHAVCRPCGSGNLSALQWAW